MSTVLAHCLGITSAAPVSETALCTLLTRSSTLSRTEARVVAMDYLGRRRDEIAAALQVEPKTLKTYWRRSYRKTGCPDRAALRAWVEERILAQMPAPTLERAVGAEREPGDRQPT